MFGWLRGFWWSSGGAAGPQGRCVPLTARRSRVVGLAGTRTRVVVLTARRSRVVSLTGRGRGC